MKILIAEDDASFRRIIQYLLERDGHDVCLYDDGEAALAANHAVARIRGEKAQPKYSSE